MKIRKINILLSFFAIILAMPSCSDVLDSAPAGRITLDDVFADNDKTGAFLNTCYADLPQKGVHYFFWTRGPVDWCDDAWDADDIDVNWVGSTNMYNGTISSSNNGTLQNEDYWSNYWTYIRDCNIFLKNIGTANVKSETDRSRWTAEAHLLRAYYYEELLSWYGCALPIEREPFELTQDFGQVKRSSYYDVVKFIVEDCDAALACPDLPWRITTNGEGGRVTKALADALKSRMILFAASPLYNGGANHWEEAYNLTKACLNDLDNNGYELYSSVHYPAVYMDDNACFPDNFNANNENLKKYSALYNEYFTNAMEYSSNPVDKETIFQSRGDNGNDWVTDGIGAQYGYKTGTCPSQELVDAFETNDGNTILDLANPYADEKHSQPNIKSPIYNEQNPYVKRDPRFYADIYYNGSKRHAYWQFDEPAACVENYPAGQGKRTRIVATWNGEPKTGLHQTQRMMTRTGYYQRKFQHPNAGNDGDGRSDPNTKLFRLAEAILNFAEAAAENGKYEEARVAVNRIRTRVGMPELPASLATAANKDEFIRRIHNERRVELCMEENRYFDIRRWTTPDGDLSKTDKWINAANITRNADGTYTYSRTPVRSNPRLCYTNKYLKMPLRLNEANLMKSLTGEDWQNPGW